jgi:hypothetical protein
MSLNSLRDGLTGGALGGADDNQFFLSKFHPASLPRASSFTACSARWIGSRLR